MSKAIPFICTDTKITVCFNGQTHIVPRTDPLADKLLEALRARQWEDIPHLVSTAKRIEKFSDGKFTVEDGKILVDGVPAPHMLGTKIVKFANENLPYEPLVKFARNLQNNPSFRAVNELFQFLEKNDHPVTENGNFIAYKKVRSDFLDIHSGSFDNSPGKVVEIPRNQVDEDSSVTCSHGLHVANWDYAKNHYGHSSADVMLEVEVNPADVVAIPVDYNQSKMRVCKYIVIGVVDQEHSSDVSIRTTGTIWNNPDRADTMASTSEDHIIDEESEEDDYYDEESSSSEEYYDEEESESISDESSDDEYPWDDELE